MTFPAGRAKSLRFKADGSFRILLAADVQDTDAVSKNTLALLEKALDRERPDLVVLLGDQIKGYDLRFLFCDREKRVEKAIRRMLAPVTERNIPFTFVFGNHDDQAFSISREKQLKIYQSLPGCLAVAGDGSLEGCGNHHIPLLSSDGSRTVFNLYCIDSLSAGFSGRGRAVSESQLGWYRSVRDSLKEENGGYVPSLLFQHIPVPEMWNVLKEVSKSNRPHAVGYRAHAGKYYRIDESVLLPGNCDFLLETPASPEENGGEFGAVSEKGDVLAMFFGHDHNNSFIAKYKNVILGYVQGCGFNAYGPGLRRGVRVVDLSEQEPRAFRTRTVLYSDFFTAKDLHDKLRCFYYRIAPPSVESAVPVIKKAAAASGVLAAGAAALLLRGKKGNLKRG